MKFGGTSVADPQKIKLVAARIVAARREGTRVVAVLSAMGDTTDDLVRLAYAVSPRPKPRELDMLISVVDGIYSADPRIVPAARKLPGLTYEELLEMASSGARVVATRSIEVARSHNV